MKKLPDIPPILTPSKDPVHRPWHTIKWRRRYWWACFFAFFLLGLGIVLPDLQKIGVTKIGGSSAPAAVSAAS